MKFAGDLACRLATESGDPSVTRVPRKDSSKESYGGDNAVKPARHTQKFHTSLLTSDRKKTKRSHQT